MPLQEITIKADNIDGAAEEIIGFLERTRQWSVIYLDGLVRIGLGASAILKAVVNQLRSPLSETATRKEAGLDKIIHIDCSLWQNKRSLQKAIAEELRLPQEVMAFFDQGDEEDDFDGVEQAARGVIPHVKWAILNELSNCKFLVVFHNGSGNYVDLWECGVPIMGVMSKRVLWTSHGRFMLRYDPEVEMEKLAGLSDVFILVGPQSFIDKTVINVFFRFLHAEAEEVARYSGVPEPDPSKIVLECILYRVLRRHYNINWAIHAANYWVCDGIIEDANDYGRSAWEIGDALHRNMNLDWPKHLVYRLHEILGDKRWRHNERHWVSLTSQDEEAEEVPTSFFAFDDRISGSMFEKSYMSKLRVLHLSRCIFSYSSPPFLSCINLRFLLLDHCKDTNLAPHDGEKEGCSQDTRTCFRNLWVLELSYTNWYWLLSKEMLDQMVELRELNVIGADNRSMMYLHHCSGSKSRMLKLRVVVATEPFEEDEVVKSTHVLTRSSKDYGITGATDNRDHVSSFPDLSNWHVLKTIILDGCGDLEEIGYNTLPPSLESFSFTNNIVATRIKKISFWGCAKLKSMLLIGQFGSLVELDMSATSVETLDLSAIQAQNLKRIFLLGCEKLRAILWPHGENKKIKLEVLRIDTTHITWAREDASKKEDSTSGDFTSIESQSTAMHGNNKSLAHSDSYISLRDPRLFRSLLRIKLVKVLHVEISSTGGHKGITRRVNDTTCSVNELEVPAISLQKATGNLYMGDIISTLKDNSNIIGADGDVDIDAPTIMWMWPCPPIPKDSSWAHCYISIQDETPTQPSRRTTSTTKQHARIALPSIVHKRSKTLHLHDNLSITNIPDLAPPATINLDWDSLLWCRLERCHGLEGSVFAPPSIREVEYDIFGHLATFWASQLLKARYIWDWSKALFLPGDGSFENLIFLHLDGCPRLVHVLPLYASNGRGCHNLETIEIVCCGELREIFPSDPEGQQQKPRKFPRLKRIHLYELPMLQHIYGHHMLAPNLKTVKIRGCWNLKRMPAVRRPTRRRHRRGTPADEAELLESTESSDSESDDVEAQTLPTVDCEKDWWDSLEWNGEEFGHHPSHYKPCHSVYHKRSLLRASVLR